MDEGSVIYRIISAGACNPSRGKTGSFRGRLVFRLPVLALGPLASPTNEVPTETLDPDLLRRLVRPSNRECFLLRLPGRLKPIQSHH